MIRADGTTSWYGGPRDSGDNNIPALPGASNKNPGVAVYNRHTLGGWWWVRYPNGRSIIVQQTDLGPAPSTGHSLDTNYTAVRSAGYTESNFPTGGRVSAVYLGHGQGHAHRQAARLGLPGAQPPGIRRAMERPMLDPASVNLSTPSPQTASAGLRTAMAGIPSTVLAQPPVNAQSGLAVALRRAKLVRPQSPGPYNSYSV